MVYRVWTHDIGRELLALFTARHVGTACLFISAERLNDNPKLIPCLHTESQHWKQRHQYQYFSIQNEVSTAIIAAQEKSKLIVPWRAEERRLEFPAKLQDDSLLTES